MSTTSTRNRLHLLIDELTDRQLSEAERLLAELRAERGPFLRALANAPEDDEPLAPEDEAAIEEAYADITAGRTIPDAELWRRLDHARTR